MIPKPALGRNFIHDRPPPRAGQREITVEWFSVTVESVECMQDFSLCVRAGYLSSRQLTSVNPSLSPALRLVLGYLHIQSVHGPRRKTSTLSVVGARC